MDGSQITLVVNSRSVIEIVEAGGLFPNRIGVVVVMVVVVMAWTLLEKLVVSVQVRRVSIGYTHPITHIVYSDIIG